MKGTAQPTLETRVLAGASRLGGVAIAPRRSLSKVRRCPPGADHDIGPSRSYRPTGPQHKP